MPTRRQMIVDSITVAVGYGATSFLQDDRPNTRKEETTENTLTAREFKLQHYMNRNSVFDGRMLFYGQCGFYRPDGPTHSLTGRSIHRVNPGHYVTRDWRLVHMPKNLRESWKPDYWSLIRKRRDETKTEQERVHIARLRLLSNEAVFLPHEIIEIDELLEEGTDNLKIQSREHRRIDREVEKWLKGKPPKIQATGPAPGLPVK